MPRGDSSDKRASWRERLRRFDECRMTVAAFCADEGVSTPSFYAWRRKIHGPTQPRAKSRPAASGKLHAFERVVVTAATAVTIRLPGGARIEVPADHPETLRTVLGELLRAEHASESEGPSC